MSKQTNLRDFLAEVDKVTVAASKESLSVYIHEKARLLEAGRREAFLEELKTACLADEDTSYDSADEMGILQKRCKKAYEELERIDAGDYYLEAEYNPEYRDWSYSQEEFLFSDPFGLAKKISAIYGLARDCMDFGLYGQAADLIAYILHLDICVEGEEWDDAYDAPSVADLEYGPGQFDYRQMVLDGLYAAYVSTDLDERPGVLYELIKDSGLGSLTFENIMQAQKELEDLDEFLPRWSEYLKGQKGAWAQDLLKEAVKLTGDPKRLLEDARKDCADHPSFYEEYLRLYGDTLDRDAFFKVGEEALEAIDSKYAVRSRIAKLLCERSLKDGQVKDLARYWLEIFRSESTVTNYLRLCLESPASFGYEDEAGRIIEGVYALYGESGYCTTAGTGELALNCVSKVTANMLRFLNGDFSYVRENAMDPGKGLGWSYSFLKCGIGAFLLLLSGEGRPGKGCGEMFRLVASEVSFDSGEYMRYVLAGEGTYSGQELFRSCFGKWKEHHALSVRERKEYLTWIGSLIDVRVDAIMGANRRNYYRECAAFIAAYAEVSASVGTAGERQRIFQSFRQRYPRRRSFLDELRAFGMK